MVGSKFVSYLRVSTVKQGASGLGLEAQRQAVAAFVNGGEGSLVAEVQEIESGKRDDRPKLLEALALCRLYDATLLIAKLDRLSRDAHFLLGLQKAGVRFVAADMPEANELTIGLLAVVAQAERKAISTRTKAALAVKAQWYAGLDEAERLSLREAGRATQLGGDRGNLRQVSGIGRTKALTARRKRAAARKADLAPLLDQFRAASITSLAAMAAALNVKGIPAPRGGRWRPSQVRRIFPHQ